jgi:hypothetical protein
MLTGRDLLDIGKVLVMALLFMVVVVEYITWRVNR